ncbi:retrotransposon protein, putative, ty1-copia subclass [Tanacetum coccineum]
MRSRNAQAILLVYNYCCFKLGNGEKARFWEDRWSDGMPLKSRFPRVYALEMCKDITVASKVSLHSFVSSFRRSPRGGVEHHQFEELMSLVSDIRLVPMADRWSWNLSSSGDFSVSSVRRLIDDKTLPNDPLKTRWVRFVPIKINVIAWKVKSNSLPSRFNISRRGIPLDSINCGICDLGVETVSHLFFSCDLVRQLSILIARWWCVPYVGVESYAEWVAWLNSLRLPSKNKSMLEGVFYIMWCSISSSSNNSYFCLTLPIVLDMKTNSYKFSVVPVEAIGSYDLVLPNGLVICLDNCHYAPSIMRGVVLVSRLVDNGFVQKFTDYGILISKNNVLYFNVVARNDVYEIDMHDLVPNNNSIYNVSNKRVKRNLDSTYLWHCRLAHINKKRIKQLQQDGLLKSTDDESFDQCESCLSGKMTKKPFPHSNERAKDLLRIIHTDVCGPLRHVSRQGASYFITFTDDYSRYGYVYLLKHKHEVFETFKVFKNEVENQLGKTIKAIRSDRGGEYISQEFKDYLKANGIVQQLTPPYTPQHNGVSERRNHTLLDMVRSMMNLTTLPISFWDYALESATRILNMVSTKKVDKTPYEMWYGNVPNLSYLKVWGCEALVKRDMPDKLEQRSVKCIFIGYPKETMGYYFYFPPENKIVVARYAEFFEERLINQEINWRAVDLEEIQEQKDTLLSEITSNIPQEVEGFGHPTKAEEILIPAYYDYEIWQMDVKTAFLNGYLDEDIYTVQPEGFIDPTYPEKYASLRDPFMVLSKHQEAGIKDLMRKSKGKVSFHSLNGATVGLEEIQANGSSIMLLKPGVQRGARHYLRKYHYVRESVALGGIKILKVHTDNNLADPFTKALSNRKLTQHARSMGLHPASSFM